MSATIQYTLQELRDKALAVDGSVTDTVREFMRETAKRWNVPVETVALMGGKPYAMQGALFHWLKAYIEEHGLEIKKFFTAPVVRYGANGSPQAIYECTVMLFNRKGFEEAIMRCANQPLASETVTALEVAYTRTHKEEGSACQTSVKMRTLHNPSFLNHMGQTRSINRCLRTIVGAEGASYEELPEGVPPDIEPGSIIDAEVVHHTEPPPATPPPAPTKPTQTINVNMDDKTTDDPVEQKQIGIALSRWRDYVTARIPDVSADDLKVMASNFIKSNWKKDSKKDLTKGELRIWLDWMREGLISTEVLRSYRTTI